MKKIVISFLILSCLSLTACSNVSDKTNSSTSVNKITRQKKNTESNQKKETITIKQPVYDLNNNKFSFSGKTKPNSEIKLYIDNVYVKTIVSDADGIYSYEDSIPTDDNKSYRVEANDSVQSVIIKSLKTLDHEAMLEEEKKVAEKKAAEEAERKKKEAEEAAKKEAEEKAKQEAKAKEEEQRRKEKEAAEKKRIDEINNSSREFKNAVSKAEDYLNFTAFSKSGLRDQLIFEQFPEDAAQFAVDHIVVNWNEQALKKAKDYLDYSSFSNQGLYDQLLFEGFSESEAQYAIDNLPN
ncbi:Ltp family lipoprotein [Enterococcus casseliflavus]|uniref:Ltp family lipoprotein n=1 Tax=Enterococcus casseliflavus TaxID=37734 RepID=UPI002DBD12F0|nr:Ltp family lipoprotein [Enterococcus casseliflavus]MEB8418944.1 Ltp family lipoprotein [Enterococcus casseliflavus]